jgi:hypothetical protein
MAEKFFSKRVGILRTTVKDNMWVYNWIKKVNFPEMVVISRFRTNIDTYRFQKIKDILVCSYFIICLQTL